MAKPPTEQRCFRLARHHLEALDALKAHYGIDSGSAIVQRALIALARAEGVVVDKEGKAQVA